MVSALLWTVVLRYRANGSVVLLSLSSPPCDLEPREIFWFAALARLTDPSPGSKYEGQVSLEFRVDFELY